MDQLKFLVLTPPQDIELKILSLRSTLFSQYGYISALVLPAMVPLLSIHNEIPGKIIKRTLKESFRFDGFTITTSQLTEISGSLYLELKECKALSTLITECRKFLIPLSRNRNQGEKRTGIVCFPLYTGFFLARNEQSLSLKEMGIHTPDPGALSFKKFSLSLLDITIYSGLETWWENLDWEVSFQIKSKKTTHNKK
ncbi:MAG: hypothetical protein JXB88_11965 [Spirochaetales bacterium]|nr:hypothetical protein [Spirochaetales bacterium]